MEQRLSYVRAVSAPAAPLTRTGRWLAGARALKAQVVAERENMEIQKCVARVWLPQCAGRAGR